MPKMDSLTHFLSKNIYNDVLWINVSKVTALYVFQILIDSCALNRTIYPIVPYSIQSLGEMVYNFFNKLSFDTLFVNIEWEV